MKERITYYEFGLFEFYVMLSLIGFFPLKVRKISNNYLLAYCVRWKRRKRDCL